MRCVFIGFFETSQYFSFTSAKRAGVTSEIKGLKANFICRTVTIIKNAINGFKTPTGTTTVLDKQAVTDRFSFSSQLSAMNTVWIYSTTIIQKSDTLFASLLCFILCYSLCSRDRLDFLSQHWTVACRSPTKAPQDLFIFHFSLIHSSARINILFIKGLTCF